MKIGTLLVAASLALPAAALGAEQASLSGLPEAAPGAEQTSLSGEDLREAIVGKTVYLNISGFELPIRYLANGRMRGSMGAVAASFSRGDGSSDSGKWWVENDQLCQKWTSWMEGQSYCYKLTREGDNVTWVRDDGKTGTARIGG